MIDKIEYLKSTNFKLCDRYQTGGSLIKGTIKDAFIYKKEAEEEIEEPVSLEKIDEQMMTIDDFLGEIK